MDRLIEESRALCANLATPTYNNYSLKMSKNRNTKDILTNKNHSTNANSRLIKITRKYRPINMRNIMNV